MKKGKSIFLKLKENNNENSLQAKKEFLSSRRNTNNKDEDPNTENIHSEEEADTLLNNIITYYQKGEYNHLLKFAESIDEPCDTFFYWKIMYLKILTYQEIIQFKMFNYFKKNKLKQINEYFTMFMNDIEEIINNLGKIKSNNVNPSELKQKKKGSFFFVREEKKVKKENIKYLKEKGKIKKVIPHMIETVISQLLKYCYYFARYCLYKKSIYDSIAFLSLGVRIIQRTFDFSSSPETLHWSSHICLFMSSILIQTKNFLTAKNYVIFAIIMCYIELELRLNKRDHYFYYIVNIKQDSNYEIFLNQIYSMLSIAFYHFGVCCENENNIKMSNTLYEQSKYFNSQDNSEYQEESNFSLFINNLLKRTNLRNQLITFFSLEEKKKSILQDIIDMPRTTFSSNEYNNKKKEIRYERVKNYIENLKIMELDDDEPDLLNKINCKPFSKKVGIPTKNIHILNYLLNNKFNNYLRKTEKLELFNLTQESRIEIQKEIKFIKREELEQKNSKKDNKFLNIKIKGNKLHKSLTKNYSSFNSLKEYKKSFKNSQSAKNIGKLNQNNLFINNYTDNSNKNMHLSLTLKEFKKSLKLNKMHHQMSLNIMPKINLFKNNKNRINSNEKNLYNYNNKNYHNFLEEIKNNKYSDYSLNNSNSRSKAIKRNKKIGLPLSFSFTSLNKNELKRKQYKNNLFPFSLKNYNLKKNINKRRFFSQNLFDLNYKENKGENIDTKKDVTNSNNNKINDKKGGDKDKAKLKIKKIKINLKKEYKSKSPLEKSKFNEYYMFDKKLMSKKNFLDSKFVRELKFQKDLLKCKSEEIYANDIDNASLNQSFNKQKVYNNCDTFFHSTLKEFLEEKSKQYEREQLNMINMKLKIQNLNKSEENEEKDDKNISYGYDNFLSEKRFKRRGALRDNNLNQNVFYLEKIMTQINKIKGKENIINLKLKEIRNKMISKDKRRHLFLDYIKTNA